MFRKARLPSVGVPTLLTALMIVSSLRSIASAQENIAPRLDVAAIADAMRPVIRAELERKAIPAIAIALVDDQDVVWAEGFGWEDESRSKRASAATIHRVGSVSKLFTDLAIMKLVEAGKLDLDAPVEAYLPDFKPQSAFGKPITLRLLMSHRSGLVREPPVGNYFDPELVSLADTVASLNSTSLIYEPGTHTKYSNAAIATVGYVLERADGRPFPEVLSATLLDPLGMRDSSFDPSPEILDRTAKAIMWGYDGRVSAAPTFPLGMAPAGSLYSTVVDLGRFMSMLIAKGRAADGTQVIQSATLDSMWAPEAEGTDGRPGFGIGFRLGDLSGHRRLGHNGAMYGFATELAFLPDEKLGAVVIVTKDCANNLAQRLTDQALLCLLAARAGEPLPAYASSGPIDPARAQRLAGRYTDGDHILRLTARDGTLFAERGGMMMNCGWRDDSVVVDDVLAYGPAIIPLGDGDLLIDGRVFHRTLDRCPNEIPARWAGLIGEYGWDHNTLYIREEEGQLHALIEWFFDYPLQEISENVFAFPHQGLYTGELLVFSRDEAGMANKVVAASVPFVRRPVGTPTGETFKITPT